MLDKKTFKNSRMMRVSCELGLMLVKYLVSDVNGSVGTHNETFTALASV